jgi:dTDP-4-dehydrorhamnose 3,5-epimerase
MIEPKLIEGGLAVDDRGELMFVNDFDMKSVRRFYTVTNHTSGFVRAWHAHKLESKYISIINGSAIIAAVKVDNWDTPSKELNIDKFIVSSKKPSVLLIPGGYAHGYKTLTEGTNLIFFSTATLEESKNDDFRYDAYYWNPWEVIER